MPRHRATGPAPLRLLLGSFLALIAAGTLLLKIPAATPPEAPLSWTDALFTATSATCVTGLVVRDTGTGFTLFGQGVILGLIQLGGLGIMTFGLFFFALVRGRVSLAHRTIVERTLASRGREELLPLLALVVRFTLTAEAAGALLLWGRWWPEMGALRAAWYALFHAVSAFCNAGFGLWADSLSRERGDPLVNLVVMTLIVLGGLGFLVVYDLVQAKGHRVHRAVQTKLALVVSAVLVVVGAGAFWLLERDLVLAGMRWDETLWASLFQGVTPRTAGFNTVPVGSLAPATTFMLLILMFVGGSPGSCAGGIKTTTLGVLAVAAWSRLRGRTRVNAFARTFTPATVRNALSVTLGGILVVVVGLFALLLLESPDPAAREEEAVFFGYLFETVSAVGTVGLSTGVTPTLAEPSRLLVSLLMLVGRLGPLTVASALATAASLRDWRYPEEDVMVG